MSKMPKAKDGADDLRPVPVSVTIAGEEYPLARLMLREMADFADWANRRLPSPFDAIRGFLAGAGPEDARAFRAMAYEEARKGPKPFADPAVLDLAQTPDGIREIFWLAIRRANPATTREAADALADQLGPDEAARVLEVAFRPAG